MDKKEKKAVIYQKVHNLHQLGVRLEKSEVDIDQRRKRNEYQRDYARILHSSAFRRLQGKMQLLGIDNSSYYRNRLTHSLEVAQISKGICLNLSRIYWNTHFWSFTDLFLIDSISIAHDIGNPPFGHAGEKVLNQLAKEFGGFEGNAQTFRILTRLERKYPDIQGLNLTKRTLLGIVKYFNTRKENIEKYLYDSDYSLVKRIREENNLLEPQTIDCRVMDLADEIAYGAHDLEDSLHQNIINTQDILYLFEREVRRPNVLIRYTPDQIRVAYEALSDIVKKSYDYASSMELGDSDDLFEAIYRKEISSRIIDILVKDVDYIEGEGNLGFDKLPALASGLKKLLFNAIKNDSEKILHYERVGEKVLRNLYEVYTDEKFNKNNALLSSTYRLFGDSEEEKKRRIIDYLAGMMDGYAIGQYKKYFGKDPFSEVYR